jgi:RNA polymerase I-specific transcription initiation factor RRN6
MARNSLTNSQLSVFPQQSLDLFESSNVKLVDIYDRFVNDWLSTLQHDIPGRSRIMKERVIRKVAAELALTQLILRRKPLNEAGIVRSTEDTSHETIDDSSPVPVNPPSSLEIGKRRLSAPRLISSDYALEPAASKTTIQSNFVAEEQEVSKSTNGTEPVYCGLASMTTFYTQRPPSEVVANLLSHWQVGSDPAAYSWQRMAQTLEEEDLQRVPKATTPKRRLQKKASQGTPLSSSQLPPVSSNALAAREWGSQPEVGEPSRMLGLQSSQAIEEDLPMTQVERGTFGGREASRKTSMKARKKKRAAGF